MKVRELLTLLKADGWIELPGTATSHRQFKHPTKPGRVTVSVHGRGNEDLATGTVRSILKTAGIKR